MNPSKPLTTPPAPPLRRRPPRPPRRGVPRPAYRQRQETRDHRRVGRQRGRAAVPRLGGRRRGRVRPRPHRGRHGPAPVAPGRPGLRHRAGRALLAALNDPEEDLVRQYAAMALGPYASDDPVVAEALIAAEGSEADPSSRPARDPPWKRRAWPERVRTGFQTTRSQSGTSSLTSPAPPVRDGERGAGAWPEAPSARYASYARFAIADSASTTPAGGGVLGAAGSLRGGRF